MTALPARALPDAEPAVRITDVTKTFGSQPVLQGVNLDLIPGRVHGLIGENGSGKSTLIKILSGYHAPSSGEVEVAGKLLESGQPVASHRAGLRFVHQHLGLVPEMNAVENMALGVGFANPRWIRWKREMAEARRELAELDIEMDVEKPLWQARAVERTAVAIARALRRSGGQGLRLLVLDEPTAALPPHEVDVLFNVIRQSCNRGLAILYVSHRLDEIEEIADEVAVLRNGILAGRVARHDNFDRDTLVALMLGSSAKVPRGKSATQSETGTRVTRTALEVKHLESATLRDVSFALKPREMLGVAGIDGSGREELARALVGAIPARGEVVVNGRRLSRHSPAAAAGAGLALVPSVTEAGSAIAAFTVKENLTLARLPRMADWRGVRGAREDMAVAEWIERLDIRPPDPGRQMALLSGGNRQKVILAKWLALENPVYVLSEPTAGVDIGARSRIHELLRAQAARGVAFVVCSTDLAELEAVCDRILVLHEGRVMAELHGSDVTRTGMVRAMADAGRPVVAVRSE